MQYINIVFNPTSRGLSAGSRVFDQYVIILCGKWSLDTADKPRYVGV
ncbi:palindromic element RPE4 domain-containing protein [Legionella sp. W05-934-2]